MPRNICLFQGEIQEMLGRIRKELEPFPEAEQAVIELMEHAEHLSEESIGRGNAMEKRLARYHSAIVALGFARRNKIRE